MVKPCVFIDYLYPDLEKVLKDEDIAVIHFNIGLHGWTEGRIPEGQYESNIKKYLEFMKDYSNGAKLIWATITPITSTTKPITLHPENNAIIVERNAIAKSVMDADTSVVINDLYATCLTD